MNKDIVETINNKAKYHKEYKKKAKKQILDALLGKDKLISRVVKDDFWETSR